MEARATKSKKKKTEPFRHMDWPADKVERRKLDTLIEYARNPRLHSETQVAQIARSITEYGWTFPVLVDEAGLLIAGHGRVLAARQLGLREVPVMVARGWTEEQKRSYRIADNQLTLAGDWDEQLLATELSDLKLAEFDLTLTGFDPNQLVAFMASGDPDPAAEEAPELLPDAVSRRGDLWRLGEHRLLCGDATDEADVQVLFGRDHPHLMVTDPPYGVNYAPEWRDEMGIDWTGQAQRRATHFTANQRPLKSRSLGKVSNDDRLDWREAWMLFPGDVIYCWHASWHTGAVQQSLHDTGFKTRAQIIWAKQHFVFSRGDYHWQHEPCWYMVREGKTSRWSGDRSQTTVWTVANASAFRGEKDDQTTGHGTQKPIECMRRPILNNSNVGDFVYDPFVGSGTTIIAAQMTERRCLAIELDPRYTDVAVRRWEQFTGEKAVLDGKRGFDAVAKARHSGKSVSRRHEGVDRKKRAVRSRGDAGLTVA